MSRYLADNIIELLRNKPCRLVLRREKQGLFLAAFKGLDPLPFSALLDSYPVLNVLREHLDLHGSRTPVPLSVFPGVKRYLDIVSSGLTKGLDIQISPDAANLQPRKMPDGFTLFFDWSVRSGCILQRLYEDIDYSGEGWYVSGNDYWQLEPYESADHRWLLSQKIQGSEILEFLIGVIPRWRRRGIPVNCSVSYSDEPAMAIDINSVSNDRIDAFVEWNISSERIHSIPSLSGYVVVDSCIMPGAVPRDLNGLVPDYSGPFSIKGPDIGVFKDLLIPKFQACLFGLADELQNLTKPQPVIAPSKQDIPDIGSPLYTPPAYNTEQLPLFSFAAGQDIRKSPAASKSMDKPSRMKSDSDNPAARFKKDAEKLAGYEGVPAESVPFSSTQPEYDAMTEKQRNWYFWWRSCVRNNEYPGTDLSYILLYCYELINNIGVSDSADAFRKLYSLWTNYHAQIPRLVNYLPLWLLDFIYVNQCPVDILQLTEDASLPENTGTADLLLQDYSLRPDLALPVGIIDCLVDYDLGQGKFYQTSGKELIDLHLPAVLGRVDQYMRKKHGKGILDIFRPPESRLQRRLPFQGAIYYPESGSAVITIVPYTRYSPLRGFMTNVVKHAENRLRAEVHFSGRFKSYTLDEEIKELIDKCIDELIASEAQQPSAVQPVTVDEALVRQLIEDSDEVRDRLLDGLDDAGSAYDLPLPFELLKPDDSDPDTLASADADAPTLSTEADERSTEAQHIIHPELPEEWRNFAASLDKVQLEALRLLYCDSDPGSSLNQLCRDNMLMPQVLLDNINEAALDTVGDIVVDSSSLPPSILEESLEMVKSLVIIKSI